MVAQIIPRKIAYVITKANFGGAQKYVLNLAIEAKKTGVEVLVITGKEGVLTNMLKDTGIRALSISELDRDVNIFKDFFVFAKLFSIFRKENPDIVHLHSSKIGGVGAVAGKLAGIFYKNKVVFTIHGWAFNEDRSFIAKFLIKIAYAITIILCDEVVAVSKAVRSQTPFGLDHAKKIKIEHPHVDSVRFVERAVVRTQYAKDFGIEEGDFVICTIAELHRIKGLEYAIRAFADLAKTQTKIKYVIIGEGDERKILEKLITDLNMQRKILLAGFKKEAYQYLKGFDLFVLPSLSEAFGYVIVEAKMAELPIVASNVGGIKEAIGDYSKAILVSSRDIKKLKEAMQKSITPPRSPNQIDE